ncbi:hypothetical protein NX059_010627 [Plenodomus lindquistii]|nr:hypothetical protein NX059_010627 [Plenodomus lindquistii]
MAQRSDSSMKLGAKSAYCCRPSPYGIATTCDTIETMLEKEAIVKLKRSHSDADDLIPMGNLTPPVSPTKATPTTRSSPSFSWSKLTDSLKAKKEPLRHWSLPFGV